MKPSESMLAPINLQRDLAGLRQLAVALVGADDAEDLLQDAACVTLATGARPVAPRSFLRGVLRNLAGKRHRARSRRLRHEVLAARSMTGETASVADLAERAELIRAMTDALLALSEPFREALLLRYFAALTPGEIAVRLGVPNATVKSRLQRGLATLRERLQARFASDWRAGLVAALGLGGHAKPALAMATLAVVGLFVTLGAIAFLATWMMGPPPPVTPMRDVTAARDISGVTMPQSESRASTSVADRVVVPAAVGAPKWSASFGIRGRCVDEQGKPLAHLRLRIAHANADLASPDLAPMVFATALTAADGTFAVHFGRQPFDLRLEILVHEHWTCTQKVSFRRAFESLDFGDLVVASLAPLRGRIVDRFDQPLPGAIVRIRPERSQAGLVAPVISDSDGRFEVSLPVGNYHCNVDEELTIERENDRVTVGSDGLDLQLRVEARSQLASLAGVIVAPDGAPLSCADITATDKAGNSFTARTGAHGGFVLHNAWIMDGSPLDLVVRHEDCDVARLPKHANWGMQGLRLPLQARVALDVQVVAARTGQPVDGFTIRTRLIAQGDESGEPVFPIRIGERYAAGHIRLHGLCRGRHEVLVEPAEGAPFGPVLTYADVDDGATLRVALPAQLRRLLRVSFADGTPLHGCHVELQQGRFGAPESAQRPDEYPLIKERCRALLLQAAVTDARGEVMLVGPADTEMTLVAFGPGCQRARVPLVDLSSKEPLELTVLP